MYNGRPKFILLLLISSLIFSTVGCETSPTTSPFSEEIRSTEEAIQVGDYMKQSGNHFYIMPENDMEDEKKALLNLYNACDNKNMAFLYAALPTKSSIYGIEGDHSAENEEKLAECLDTYFIDAIRPKEFDTIGADDFYTTSGALNSEGSYKAYLSLIDALDRLYSVSYGIDGDIWSQIQKKDRYEKMLLTDSYTGEYALAAEGENATSEEYYSYVLNGGSYSVKFYRGDRKLFRSPGSFKKVFVTTDEEKQATGELDYILSDSYTSAQLINEDMSMNIAVIHNLPELSALTYLAGNFGSIYAFDLLNSEGATATEYVSSLIDVPVAVFLIDPSRPLGNIHKGNDIQNIAISTKARAVRSATREMIEYTSKVDVTPMANNLIALESKVAVSGADIIYISAPPKLIEGYTELPEGMENHTNENLDNFLSLIDGKVDYIDCRELFKEQGYPEEKWFYLTDHHWREESAFMAYLGCMDRLKTKYHWTDLDPEGRNTDRSNFNFDLFTDYYVGSQTREKNRYYVGYDDFYFITPKFDTSITYKRTPETSGIVRQGDFYTALIDQKFLDLKDPISNKYAAYIGGDYHSNKILNSDPTCSDKRVLIVEDSFSLPFDCFMCLNFKELHIIDIRFYSLRSISQYVDAFDIDMVIIMYTPEALYNRQVQFKFR